MPSTPPLSTEPLRFALPPIHTRVLSNGTPVSIIAAPNEDLVTITVGIRTGARHDVIPGETSVTAQMLNRGTERRTAAEFAEEVERRGCSLRTLADADACSVQASGLIEWFDDLVALAAEALTSPRFDARELDVLRERIIADILVDLVDVEWLALRACAQGAYGSHPYGRPRNGNPTTLRTLTPDTLRGVHTRILDAPRHIIVAGPVDPDVILPVLEAGFGGLPRATASADTNRAEARPGVGIIAGKDDAVQSAFRIALPCVPFDHPDSASVQLLTGVLGGYTLARLFTILREEKGYTYGAYAFNEVRPMGGLTGILTSVGNEFTLDTMRVIAHEVDRIGSERINDEEFENARQQILGTFARSNETPQQTASLVWTTIQHDLPSDFFAQHIARLQALTPDDVRDVQRRIFSTDAWVVGIAGQPDLVREAITPYVRTIEVWNPEGYE